MLLVRSGRFTVPVILSEWSLVLRNTRQNIASAAKRAASIVFGFSAVAAVSVFQTDAIAHQDIAGLMGEESSARWLMHLEEQPGETVLSAHMAGLASYGIDPIITGSNNSDMKVSTTVRNEPVPQKINRAAKGPRVVSAPPKQPPIHFSAGSVLQRQNLLESLNTDKKLSLSFVKPKPHLEALKIAAAFHPTKPAYGTDDLPVMVASLVEESRSSILAYSPEPEVQYSPFAAILEDEQPINIIPRLGKGDHSWAADPLPKRVFSDREQSCLARGIYFEARGEPVRGQAAVAQVILNRVRNPTYPNTICGVVYQNKNWRNRCQFSFACDRIRDNVKDKRLWSIAKHVAGETTAGRIWLPQVGSSTHYHATYVRPGWARRMKKVGRIGLHIFYRTYGGGWS